MFTKWVRVSYGDFLYLNSFLGCRRRRWSPLLSENAPLVRGLGAGVRRSAVGRRRGRRQHRRVARARLLRVHVVLHHRRADVVHVRDVGLRRLVALLGGLRLGLVQQLLLELVICNELAGVAAARLRDGAGRPRRRVRRRIEQQAVVPRAHHGLLVLLVGGGCAAPQAARVRVAPVAHRTLQLAHRDLDAADVGQQVLLLARDLVVVAAVLAEAAARVEAGQALLAPRLHPAVDGIRRAMAVHLSQLLLLAGVVGTFLALIVDGGEDENVEQQQEAADDDGGRQRRRVALELDRNEAREEAAGAAVSGAGRDVIRAMGSAVVLRPRSCQRRRHRRVRRTLCARRDETGARTHITIKFTPKML